VGRQGQFPHGITITTTADYFALGQRSHAFLLIAPQIAEFEEYRLHLIEHVVQNKLRHWDKGVRELAAQSLYRMTSSAPGYILDLVLPPVIQNVLSPVLEIRHGAILAVSEIVLRLSELREQGIFQYELSAEVQTQLRNIVPKVEAARLFLGRGGVYMRAGVCKLMASLARSGMDLPQKTILRLQDSFDEVCILTVS
jgi:hypothetical protein